MGWVAKGLVYGLIGGMCCRGALDTSVTQNASAKVEFCVPPCGGHRGRGAIINTCSKCSRWR